MVRMVGDRITLQQARDLALRVLTETEDRIRLDRLAFAAEPGLRDQDAEDAEEIKPRSCKCLTRASERESKCR